jgi:hypothetical protein
VKKAQLNGAPMYCRKERSLQECTRGDENLRPHVDCSSQQGRECGKRILDTQPP